MRLNGTVLSDKLEFPEGPVVLPDGSVLVVEIAAKRVTRVRLDGGLEVIAEPGGGPNGLAMGPDGLCYICNNGGFNWVRDNDNVHRPVGIADDYSGGRIELLDIATGQVRVLYDSCNGKPLKGPNDIVFDGNGGFWFTDLGKVYERSLDRGAVYYARTDGSFITEVAFPVMTPNGIGLSPDDKRLYVAETETSRLWVFDIIGEGVVEKAPWPSPHGGEMLYGSPRYQRFDSLAVEANGNVCVATLIRGGISVISPQGELVEFWSCDDPYCTNIAFGGDGLKTAFITLSGSGQLISVPWSRPGHALHFSDTA